MKNTLRIALMVIGIGMIGFGIYFLFFSDEVIKNGDQAVSIAKGNGQSYAMMAFGALCLLSGIAYKRRRR